MVIVQLLSHLWLFVTWTAAHQAPMSSIISWSLIKFMSIELMMLSNHLSLCALFSFCSQSFPASGSFQMSQFFASDGQSFGVSAAASVLPMNIQDWFPLGWTGLISWLSKWFLRVFSSTTVWKHQFFNAQPLQCLALTFIHDYWKNLSFDYMDLSSQSDISAF